MKVGVRFFRATVLSVLFVAALSTAKATSIDDLDKSDRESQPVTVDAFNYVRAKRLFSLINISLEPAVK